MPRYYVNTNAQENGDHEVHREGCSHPPAPENRRHLGNFPSCHPAVKEASKYYPRANGCFYCSPECHKT